VHRSLGEQQQHGRTHVTAPTSATTAPPAPEMRSESGTEARTELGTEAVPSTVAMLMPLGSALLQPWPVPPATPSEFSIFRAFHDCLLRLSCSFHVIDDISAMHR
jgi:hypothetical protein